MPAERGLSLLSEGLKLNLEERGLLIRAGWVTLVSIAMFWLFGAFTLIGFQAPYAKAGDVETVLQSQADSFQSSVDRLTDQVALEAFRKTRDPKWTEMDELRLSQLQRQLYQEKERLEKLKLAVRKK